MAEMFRTLQRMSACGSQRVPGWLSTHPDPGDRVQKTQQRMAAAGTLPAGLKVEHDSFLQRLDGIVFGEDPRNGYFTGASFLHPTLRFQLDFPSGWKAQNQADQVLAISSAQDAVVVLTLAGSTSPAQALTAFLGQQGISGQRSSSTSVHSLPAALGSFTAQTQQGPLAGFVGFISLDGGTYRVLAYTAATLLQQYDAVLQRSITSFRRLTDPQAIAVRPQRIRIVRLSRAMSLGEFNQAYPSVIPVAELALINGVEANATFPAGALVKRVVVE